MKREQGFTLTELLVVVAIIVLMTGLMLPNWRSGDKSLSLSRVVHKAGQDVKRVQELSLRAEAFDDCPINTSITGYGIVFDTNWSSTQYRLFANCKPDGDSDDHSFGVNDMVLANGTITLENDIEIVSITPSPSVSILFIPPTPLVFIKPGDPLNTQILFQRTDRAGAQKTLDINSKGVIDID